MSCQVASSLAYMFHIPYVEKPIIAIGFYTGFDNGLQVVLMESSQQSDSERAAFNMGWLGVTV
jgi:hypothetical protein